MDIVRRLDQIYEKINNLEKTFYENMESQQNKQKALDKKMSNMMTKLDKMKVLETSIGSLASNMVCFQENMEELVRKMDRMETSLNTTLKYGQDAVTQSLADFRTEVNTDLTSVNDGLRNTMDNFESILKVQVTSMNEILEETRVCVKSINESNIASNVVESVTANINLTFNKTTNSIKQGRNELKKLLADFRTEAKIDMQTLDDCLRNTLRNLESTINEEVTIIMELLRKTNVCIKQIEEANIAVDGIKNLADTISFKFDETTKDTKNYFERTKHELFAMTGKETQTVIDKICESFSSPLKHTFDLCLMDFKSLVGSGKTVTSLPWYIKEINTCVRGKVELSTHGKMFVSVELVGDPSRLGLPPLTGNMQLEVKVRICDRNQNSLRNWPVGEVMWKLGNREELIKTYSLNSSDNTIVINYSLGFWNTNFFGCKSQ